VVELEVSVAAAVAAAAVAVITTFPPSFYGTPPSRLASPFPIPKRFCLLSLAQLMARRCRFLMIWSMDDPATAASDAVADSSYVCFCKELLHRQPAY